MEFYKKLFDLPCQMTTGEKLSLVTILELIRPDVAIEIGNGQGGSLAILSAYSKKVYAVDFKEVHDGLNKKDFSNNVCFVSGNSRETLPALLRGITERRERLGFVLVDGDHSTEGVRSDLNCLLDYLPGNEFVILCHDSFNPPCRRGILGANLQADHVHYVDLDYLPGVMFEDCSMWGGFALIEMWPVKRQGSLVIRQRFKAMFKRLLIYFKLRRILNKF